MAHMVGRRARGRITALDPHGWIGVPEEAWITPLDPHGRIGVPEEERVAPFDPHGQIMVSVGGNTL